MSKEFKIFLGYADDADKQIEVIKKLESSIDEYIKKEANELNPQGTVFSNCKYFEWRENASLSTGGQDEKITPDIEKSDLCIFIFKSRIGHTTRKEVELARSLNKHIICLFPSQIIFAELMTEGFDDYKKLSEIKEYKKSLTNDWNKKGAKSTTPIEEYDNDTLSNIAFENIKKVIKEFYNQQVEELISKVIANTDDIESEKEKINLHIHSKIPPKDPKFIDRKEDIKEIIESVKNHNECMVYSIKGLGGIGKSAITTEICHIFKSTWDNSNDKEYLTPILGDKKYFQDGILWIRFEEDISFERHIEMLSESIDYKLEYRNNIDELKNKIEEIFYANDILIVLDSAEQNKENFTKFYKIFFGLKPIIVTTREKFDFIENIKDLNKLDEDDARELFTEYMSSSLADKEIQMVDDICKEVDYLPLAIIIMAKMADDISLKEVRDDVNQKLSYKRQMPNYADLKAISIEDVFDISFNPLSDDEKRVLSVASIFNYPFTKESLDNIAKNSSKHLTKLVNKSLIKSENDGEGGLLYSFHPLMREFALNHFEKLNNKQSLKKAKVEYFLNIVKSQKNKLNEHMDEILSILKSCEDDEKFISFVDYLNWWLNDFGYWSDRERLLKEAIKKSKNEMYKNHFKVSMGDVYNRQNKLEDAKQEFHDALKYFSVDVDSGKYLFINYSLNNIKYNEEEYKNSYISNFKFIRKSLYLNEVSHHGGFAKTNGWITNTYTQKDLTTKFLVINFIQKVQNIKDINAMLAFEDIIDYLIKIEEYLKAEKIIDTQIKYYREYAYFDYFLFNIININIENEEFNNNELLSKCEIDANKRGQKSTLDEINNLKGKTHLYQDNLVEAKKYFNRLDDEYEKNFWLARCEIKSGEFEKAKKYLKKAKDFYIKHENIFEIARADIYLGFITSKSDMQKANEILSKSKAVFDKFDFTPKEYEEVIKQIDCLKIDTSGIEVENTSFFLENLPSSIQLQDDKEMMLIPKGMSFYGKGEQKQLTIDEIVENTESFFESDRYAEFKDNIYLYDFYIDKECVTNREYITFCESADVKIPSFLKNISEDKLNEPVCDKKLSIEDAKAYAKFYEKELPLPEEWEKAFRGEKGSLHFKGSTNKDLLRTYDIFELTEKHSFSGNENRFRNSSEKYKLIDSFSKNEASKKFIFRCVKPIFSMDDLK